MQIINYLLPIHTRGLRNGRGESRHLRNTVSLRQHYPQDASASVLPRDDHEVHVKDTARAKDLEFQLYGYRYIGKQKSAII